MLSFLLGVTVGLTIFIPIVIYLARTQADSKNKKPETKQQ